MSEPIFRPTLEELDYLRAQDAALGLAIDAIGPLERETMPDLFEALAHAIVGQQISSRAHATVWARIREGLGTVTPETVLTCGEEALFRFGISMRKAGYLCSAARAMRSGALSAQALAQQSDADFCRVLVALPGVGLWTAEMLLIFSLQRRDVLSFGDFGIRRGMRMLYRRETIDRAFFEECRRRYSPCGTSASLYLWAVAAGRVPGLFDPAAADRD